MRPSAECGGAQNIQLIKVRHLQKVRLRLKLSVLILLLFVLLLFLFVALVFFGLVGFFLALFFFFGLVIIVICRHGCDRTTFGKAHGLLCGQIKLQFIAAADEVAALALYEYELISRVDAEVVAHGFGYCYLSFGCKFCYFHTYPLYPYFSYIIPL